MRVTAYRDNPLKVDVVETHISWVFLTDKYAYKLKKPVRFEFLDFTIAGTATIEPASKNYALIVASLSESISP